jgi:two-component system cell cycle sensor histidine kinase/response regulator CckA
MASPERTVLIVDDDRQILGLVEKMLRPQGVTVLSASRPSEALKILEERAVKLLISDVMMPEMDGGKLAERLLKLQPDARVLLISGQGKVPAVAKLPQVRFLRKPFFPSVLVQLLHELLGEI